MIDGALLVLSPNSQLFWRILYTITRLKKLNSQWHTILGSEIGQTVVHLRTMWATTLSFPSCANSIRFFPSSLTKNTLFFPSSLTKNRAEANSFKLRASFFDYPLASRIIVKSKLFSLSSFIHLNLLYCLSFMMFKSTIHVGLLQFC